MSDTILIGQKDRISKLPQKVFEQHLAQVPDHAGTRLSFMSEAHHRVRYFVVKELPNSGRPLEPETISRALDLPLEQTLVILAELERNLFFLVRNKQGAVTWTFPVTVEPTPHRLSFSSGERLYGAWAEDAVATSFVQGRLRHEALSVTIETECGHCRRPIRITLDSDLAVINQDEGSVPLVFMPQVDWESFTEPNIIDAYWRNSLFFWSEEHAREYRARVEQVDGTYLTLAQCAYAIPVIQGALFAFR